MVGLSDRLVEETNKNMMKSIIGLIRFN